MTSLSDRLKSLGVQLGAGNLQPAAPRAEYPIYSVVGGTTQLTDFGEAYFVERFIPSEETHGLNPLRFPSFLDTESTGIWGSGTLAFLIGLGRFEPGGFRQVQYFLREPIEERAILEALNRQGSPADAPGTFK